jgi:integrase
MDTTHLKKRAQTWYARLAVPPSLQPLIGKTEIVRSLKTRDLREANQKKHRVLADLRDEMHAAAANRTMPKDTAEYVLATARQLRGAVAAGQTSEEDAATELDAALEDHLELAAKKSGRDEESGHPLVSEAHEETLRLAHRVLASGDVTLLSDAITRYLAEIKSRIRNTTYMQKDRQLAAFKKWLRHDCDVASITKKLCGQYTGDVLMRKGLSAKTIKDELSNLSAFFAWLETSGEIENNPWRGMSKRVKESSRGKRPKRRPWSNDELLSLVNRIPTEDPLWSMAVVAAYSGMRIDEIASLTRDNVTNNAFRIVEGKTEGSVRFVPIHPLIAPLVQKLKQDSTDGYLIPGLLNGGSDAKRSHYASKRFGYLIRSAGFTDRGLTFHTLRNAFMHRCELATVPESTTKLIVGHARQSLTYGLYSPGVEFDLLKKETGKVSYGKADAQVRKLGKNVKVTMRSRRRPRASYNSSQRKAA